MSRRATAGRPLRVDVVINNYNYGRFLRDAIDSALAQTYDHVRVLVVDDGSTDESREVIRSYGERVVSVLKENGGQASALNAGFARTEGDVVIFLDADDVLAPWIAERVATLPVLRRGGVAKIQWRMEVVDEDGTPTGTPMPPAHIPMPNGDMRRAELAFPFDIVWMAMSGNAFPTAVLREIMPIPEAGYRLGADSYLQHLTPLLGLVVSLDDVGTLRRLHGANGFEQSPAGRLSNAHIHAAIDTAAITGVLLDQLAERLKLPRPSGPARSVADLGTRLVSLRIDPAQHPIPGDRRSALALAGARAARGRFDVHPAMRLVFGTWFVLTAVAPRPLALRLGRWFLFPEQRAGINRILARLHRGHPHTLRSSGAV